MTMNEVGKLMDTILSIPGMNDPVRIDVKMSRKQVLLMSNLLEKGISGKEGNVTALMEALPKEVTDELEQLLAELLGKAGLTELYGKLKLLGSK
ncbi:hypothetical protein [Olivibacter jilunii]|uniref:hypothetical protein n=1 Tax=Olivibacter jilunii TaxID=985016 RepID=UPI001F5ED996|nr:hypothetical protein [Olivibacter jilunii]